MSDIVRVVRVMEYIGHQEWVEKQIAKSIHTDLVGMAHVVIRATTLGEFPTIVEISESELAQLKNKAQYLPKEIAEADYDANEGQR